MKKYVAFFALAFLLSGCVDDDDAKKSYVNLALKGFVDTEPLSFSNKTYSYNGTQFYFIQLKFFVSEVKLVKTDNSEVPMADAGYFEYGSTAWQNLTGQVPAGTYKAIKFNVGLTPQQNATNPADYSPNEVLGPKDDMYWSWLGHRFINLEGRAGSSFQVGLTYHVGTDACLRPVTLSGTEFTVNEGETANLNLNLDVLKVFTGDNAIDMLAQPGTQSEPSDIAIAEQFSTKFAGAFTYSK